MPLLELEDALELEDELELDELLELEDPLELEDVLELDELLELLGGESPELEPVSPPPLPQANKLNVKAASSEPL